ncbi:MAG: Gfo/Idh/MocA family oxidoreductase [Candidatus Bathyarchaeum tardum]|nr:MAG: Gfo/Idh/MocA family oxidoreductase [Candidatus Bathyarchaeum tardum]
MKVKVGVVGLGFMGSAHARVYKKLNNCELVAICDSDPTKKELADSYDCKFCSDLSTFLEQDLDAVSVCTPTSMHHDVVSAVLDAGKHVLVEKPFADSLTKGESLVKKAIEADKLLGVGYIERFNSAVRSLKEVLDCSKIFSTVSMRFGPFPPRTKYSGVFLDLASHEIDLLNYLFGEVPKVLYAHFSSKINNNFEDYAYISLKYGHIHSHIEASWLPNYKVRQISLYANERFYSLNYAQQKLKMYRAPPKANIVTGNWEDILWLSRHINEEIPVSVGEPLLMELQCFVDSVKQNELLDPLCSPQEALNVLKVTDCAFRKAKVKTGCENQ